MGKLVKEMTSGEDLGKDVKGFPRGGVEGIEDKANAFVEHKLGTCTEGAVLVRGGPQLAAIGQDREADCIEDEAPVSHGEATMRVAQNLESLEGSTGSIAHDGDMRFPIKAEVNEEAQVTHHRFRSNPVVCMGSLIHEVQAIRGGVEANRGGGGWK